MIVCNNIITLLAMFVTHWERQPSLLMDQISSQQQPLINIVNELFFIPHTDKNRFVTPEKEERRRASL